MDIADPLNKCNGEPGNGIGDASKIADSTFQLPRYSIKPHPANVNTYDKESSNQSGEYSVRLRSGSQPGLVEVTLPIVTVSEANSSEHWHKKAIRHKHQKGLVYLMLNPMKDKLKLPCTINLTRLAPRKLDRFDNLPMSMKYILDAVCEVITGDKVPGRADSHEGLTVTYDQITNKNYGVIITINFD